MTDTEYETTEWRGVWYPTPGKWELNWVEGDVISYRYDPDDDARIHDGASAYVFASLGDYGQPVSHDVRVDGEHVETIDDPNDHEALMREIARVLREHAPDDDHA